MAQDERKKDVAGKAKPIPIREAVGEPGPGRAGNSDTKSSDTRGGAPTPPAPGLRGQRKRPQGPGPGQLVSALMDWYIFEPHPFDRRKPHSEYPAKHLWDNTCQWIAAQINLQMKAPIHQ